MAIGNALREAREKLGLSTQEVEEATKIRRKYIQALEDENFEIIPGKVYVRGFLRSYARFLSIDGESLVQEYNQMNGCQVEEETDPQQEITVITKNTSKRYRKYFTVAAAVVLLAGFIYVLGSSNIGLQNQLADEGKSPKTTENGSLDGAGQEGKGEGTADDTAQNNVEITGMDVVLQVTDAECWMRIVVDDQNAFEGLVGPGSIKTFKGEESVQLKLGNAGAVKVKVNGKDYGFLGAPGQVITRAFQVDSTG